MSAETRTYRHLPINVPMDMAAREEISKILRKKYRIEQIEFVWQLRGIVIKNATGSNCISHW